MEKWECLSEKAVGKCIVERFQIKKEDQI